MYVPVIGYAVCVILLNSQYHSTAVPLSPFVQLSSWVAYNSACDNTAHHALPALAHDMVACCSLIPLISRSSAESEHNADDRPSWTNYRTHRHTEHQVLRQSESIESC